MPVVPPWTEPLVRAYAACERLAQSHYENFPVASRLLPKRMRPHIAAGAVYVVPLRIGGGTRLKIFEAMSMAKAVVSTTVGAEGLPVTSGRDIVIADEPARFAQAVVHMIRDVDARRQIEAEARRIVVERYDWSAVAQDFEEALAGVVADGAGRAPRQADLGTLGAEPGPRAPHLVGVALLRLEACQARDDGVGRAVAEARRAERSVERARDPRDAVEDTVVGESLGERTCRPHRSDGVRTRGADPDREEIEG